MAVRKKPGFNNYQEPTPQAKLINASNRFGNGGLKNSQGSTYCIYDSLLLPQGLTQAGTTFKFFENTASRIFPFTNLREGRLPVAEGFVLERMWFTVMTVVNATGEIITVGQLVIASQGLYKSDFEFFNANNRVIKPTPIIKQLPAFNWKAWHQSNEVIHLDTDITIQPLIEFKCQVTIPTVTLPVSLTASYYLQCYCEGSGAIMNPRANF